ncbi:NAD(P)-binding domain-containing protein [Pseudomonas koreensis]
MHNVLFIGKGVITSSIASYLTGKEWCLDYYERSSTDLRTINISEYNFVVSCLPDAAIAKGIWNELLDCALTWKAYNTQFIEISTLTCEIITNINKIFCKEKFSFIEAPFTGSKSGALNGSLIYFAYSESTSPETNEFLKATSSRIYNFNGISGATQFKLFYNLWGLSCLGLMSQMLPLLNALPEKELAAEIVSSNDDFWMGAIARQKLSQSLSANYEDVHCKLKYAIKDIRYALDEFSGNKLDLSECLLAILDSEHTLAYENSDFTSMREFFR